MSDLARLTLVDVAVVALVVLAGAGALRRRSGLLGAAGAAVAAMVLSWLAVVAVAAFGPAGLASAADHSRLLHAAPAPHRAVDQARQLVHDVAH